MALNIKNPEVEALAARIAALTGESKTEAIRKALLERNERLAMRTRLPKGERALAFLEAEFWSLVPPGERGRRWSKAAEARALGYGRDGV